ncbi:ABC transporter substrate-binding protein [Inquilinus sp. NPDC058860]|uniref:ABC transporter substrate-binding protein n=1 Tax=Inquilinus sp. NPDC058860 TaxID=3346652 RepID=UPI0036C94B17
MATLITDRRQVLKLGAALGGLAASGLPMPALAQDKRVRMFWWGSKERADRTAKVNKLYEAAHPGTAINGETLGWPDYWPRLATQTAGRNAPDVIQMDYRYIVEYARRGALLPLDEYLPSVLKIEDFGKPAIDCGRVEGKLYGVNLGNNSTAIVYDAETLQQIGVEEPGWEWSWAQWGDWSLKVAQASKRDGFWGIGDCGGIEPALDCWLRQKGKALYTAEGRPGFDAEVMAEWFGFWHELRQKKAIPPADIQALDKQSPETSMLALLHSAAIITNSNQLVAHQVLSKTKLKMTMQPSGGPGAKPGQYLKPSMLFSIAARSQVAEEAVRVANFYVTDVEAGKVLGVERGVPASKTLREAVAPTLDELSRAMLDYVSFITDKVGDLPPSPPKGAGEINFLLKRVNEQVGFDQASPADGAKQFVDEANSILDRG